jgi:hypothetical protein
MVHFPQSRGDSNERRRERKEVLTVVMRGTMDAFDAAMEVS